MTNNSYPCYSLVDKYHSIYQTNINYVEEIYIVFYFLFCENTKYKNKIVCSIVAGG